MSARRWIAAGALVTGLLHWSAARTEAGQLRFHYVPVDAHGNVRLQPAPASGTEGEYRAWFGALREPYRGPPRPTHLVTFRHPCTGRTVTVPIRFPEGTPRLEHTPRRIVFDYGSYTVEAHFLADGSVDLVYNSGFLRLP